MAAHHRSTVGQRLAPPRFILFGLVFAAALAAFIPWLGRGRGIMAGFDVAAVVFLVSLWPLFRHEAERMRESSRVNDANRTVLLGFTLVTMLVVLVTVAGELTGRNDALVIATLALSWCFSSAVYALHYAHLFYLQEDGTDAGGLDVPQRKEPDYWDFLYFSVTMGMTFQTSDISITSGKMRRVATGHTLAAFVFNLGVIAFTVNVLGG